MAVSANFVTVNGISICYDTLGDPDDPALLLVAGLGVQMITWEPEFTQALASSGFFVVWYDNRDVGLSSEVTHPDYTLSDMAADGIGLLTALGIEKAHILGVSLGGMLAQLMAIEHPDHVLSLGCVMSTTGNPADNEATREAIEVIGSRPPSTREEAIEQTVFRARYLAGTAFPFDDERHRRRAAAAFDRASNPDGKMRHRRAARDARDRTPGLRALAVPTVVIHGDADPAVTVSGGRAIAAAVPDAHLVVIPGMGHEVPPDVNDQIVSAVVRNAQRSGFIPSTQES